MFQSSFVSKRPFVKWLRSLSAEVPSRPARRPALRHYGPALDILEDRLAPANFSEVAGVITLTLTATNETIAISSNAAAGNNYTFATNLPNTFGGSVSGSDATFSGFGASTGTLLTNLLGTGSTTQIKIDDGGFAGGRVVFSNSGNNTYTEIFNVSLTNAASGNIEFFGTSTFNANLTALTTGTDVQVFVHSGAVLNLNGTTTTLTQTAVTSGSGAVQISGAINTSATATALNVNAFFSIAEAATGVIKTNAATTGTFTLTGGPGDINLDGGPNDFAGPVIITQSGAGSVTNLFFRNIDPSAVLPALTGLTALTNYTLVTDNASIPLANGPNLPNSVHFDYTAGSDITQTAALTFLTANFTVLGDNSILLNTIPAGNTIGIVGFNAPKGDNTTQVSYLGSGGVNIGFSNLGLGTFNVTAQGAGSIAETGNVVERIDAAGSTFTLAGTGTTINLNAAINRLEGPITLAGPVTFTTVVLTNTSLLPQFPTFPASVTTLFLNYPNAAINLPSLGATITTLNVRAQGIFQQTGTALILNAATSVATFDAGANPIVLGNANDFSNAAGFGIQVNNSGPNQVVINDINDLNFGFGTSQLGNGTLTVAAGGNITQSRAIRQAINAGQTSFTAAAGNSITLNNIGNTLWGIVDLFTTAAGSASVTNRVALNMGTSVIGTTGSAATLTLNVIGSLTQDQGTTLTVAGSSNLTASIAITLDNNGNTFHGIPSASNFVSVNASYNATIRASGGPINLGNCSVPNNFIVRAGGGPITQVAGTGITAVWNSLLLFDAGTNAVILANGGPGGNVFTGFTSVVSTGTGTVATFKGNTTSGSMTVSSVSSVTGLAIGQVVIGPGIPAGTTITAVGATTITLSNAATATATGVTLTANVPVQLSAVGTIQLGRLDLGAGPGIGLPALIVTPGAGNSILEAGGFNNGITQAPLVGAASFTMQQGGNGLNEAQSLSFTATTGSFAIAFNGQVTAPLPVTATAAAVQSALQALSGVGVGNVAVTGGTGNFVVRFQGALANTNVAPLTLVSAGNIVLTTTGAITLGNFSNNWSGLINVTGATPNGLTLANTGSINFVVSPAPPTPPTLPTITGAVSLSAGQTITMPNMPYTFASYIASAKETVVQQNITTTVSFMIFTGTVSFTNTAGTTLDTSAGGGFGIAFNGDVITAGALTLNLASGRSVFFNQGVWQQGTNALTINGSGVAFLIGSASGPATFNMINGTISMPGGGNINVGSSGGVEFATFEVGDTARTTTVDTVHVNNGAGLINFFPFSTLSVGLGATNDRLVDDVGSVVIDPRARLTAYSGVAGASATPVLTATFGTVTGLFAMTFDPNNANVPHVFLMGTDIVLPAYTGNSVTVIKGGKQSAAGSVTGFEADGDGYVIAASTGAGARLTTATDVNGLLDVVVRNAPGAVTLTITTTVNLGDGITQLGGIAVDGPGAATITAANTDINFGGVNPFADILVQGPLVALTLRDFGGNLPVAPSFQDFIRAGGLNSQTTTIAGRRFDSVSISLPTVLSALTLADYNNTVAVDTVTAERFGTIMTTGVAGTFVLGDFIVRRLTNRNTAGSTMAGLGAVTIANKIQGQFDIQKAVTSVTSKLANTFSLGLAGSSNNPNGDLMGNVGPLNLGIVVGTNIESIGNVSSTTVTSWFAGILRANNFGSIKTTGNATLPAADGTDVIFGSFRDITLTATGNAAGVGLGTLTVAGDAIFDAFSIFNGNVTTITVGRQMLECTLDAGIATPLGVIVDPVNSKVGTIAAAAIGDPTPTPGLALNARLLTSLNAIGNATAGIFGDINSSTVFIQGMPNGAPIFTGVGIATVKATRNVQNSSVTVVNGSLTTVSVGYQMSNDDILLLNNAGKLGSLTAGAWNGQLTSGLVAQSIGTMTIKGAPLVVPSSPLLIGNLTNVNILAFVNSGATVGIGTLMVTGNYTLPNNGFLRSDNGITTFTVGRDVSGGGGAALISVRNANTGKLATITVGRWNNAPGTVDFVADSIGTMSVTGYTSTEVPSKTSGDFLATNFVLLNNSKVDATSITVQFNQSVTNLLAPGGIGTLTVGVALVGRVDADNPTGALGAITTLQAGVIGDLFSSATLRAVTFGTLKTVINISLSVGLPFDYSANGAMENPGDSVTATSTTAATGIATVNIASFINGADFNVPRSITTFTVGEDIKPFSEIGAAYQAGQKIGTMNVGQIAFSVVTANNIGILNVNGKSGTVLDGGVLTGDVVNSVITALGNISGVGLGTVTVKHKVVNSDINVAGGNFTALTVGGMFESHVEVGAHPAAYDNITAAATAANWTAQPAGVTFKLGSFKTTGLINAGDVTDTASFRDSFIVAQQLGTIVITGLDQNVAAATTTSGGSPAFHFGVAFRGTPPLGAAGTTITVTFSNGGILTTQMITAPAVVGTSKSTTPVSAFQYANLAA
jgi:hypothetical protein